MDVTALNNGTPVTGAKNTYLGLESIIQSLTVKAAGETVVKIDNYPLYCAQEYKNMNVGNKKLLQQMTGYGNVDVFQTNSTVSTNFHPVIGFFHPENSGFFPVWALPNQSLELVIVLSDPSTVFTDGLVNELQVSNVRVILPYITPPPQVVINATRAIADGKSIFYDYTRSTQTENASSGGLRNTYQLHMSGVRSLAGFTASFIDDDVLADPSKDKALAFGSQNLREWRMSLGPNLTIPSGVQGFTHSPTDKTTLLVTQLSMNDFTQLGDLDISFADYDAKQFSFGYGFQSKDESSHAALSFEGNMKGFSEDAKITGFDSGEFKKVSNANGELLVNDVSATEPLTTQTGETGIANLSLEFNEADLKVVDGSLNVIPIEENGLSLFTDGSLDVSEETGLLSVVKEEVHLPLVRDGTGIKLQHDESLKVTHGMLSVDMSDPLYMNMESKLSLDHDTSLRVDGEGRLGVVTDFIKQSVQVEEPLEKRVEDNVIKLAYGRGLKVEDGELVNNTDEVLKPLGALHTGGLLDMGMDELTELGYDALADLTDEIPDTDITLIRLRTSDDFTQKNTLASFGGKALAIRSKGNQKIPFYGVFDGFNVSDRFEYNDTLSTLSVPRVKLTTSFNPDSNEAVTQNYVSQFIQAGEATDLTPETNNRRQVNIRRDATLQIDGANNLGVNVEPLVDGKTLRIVNGKISNDMTYQAGNGGLKIENQNQVKLAPTVSGLVTFDGNNTFGDNLTVQSPLTRTENALGLDLSAMIDNDTLQINSGKIVGSLYHFGDGFSVDTQLDGHNTVQMELEGSEHIQVQGNKISTTLKPYTAGQNVTISNNTISVNIPEEQDYSAGAGLSLMGRTFVNNLSITGGSGVVVTGSATTGYYISSTLKQDKDDDEDEKEEDSEDKHQTDNSETVQTNTNVNGTYTPISTVTFLTARVGTAESTISSLQTSKQNIISISSGLTLTGSTLGYDSSILGTKASVDALTTRVGAAESNISSLQTTKQNNVSVTTGLTLTGSTLGYDTSVIGTKASVDALTTRVGTSESNISSRQTSKEPSLTIGTGLTRTGATLSVNAAQPTITSVGTLTSLTVSGNANLNASSSTLTVGVANGTINLGDPGNASGKIQSDPNHAYYPRINYAGVGKAAFYAYGDMEFYNGGLIAAQTVKMTIQASGTVAIAKDLQVHGGINIPFTGHIGLDIGAGDGIIRAISKVVRIGTSGGNSILDIFDGGVVVNSGNLTVATAPTLVESPR
ncbi:hypothetical protein PhCBS80983_g06200 [Powellomyces hirtus]|uniref:Uncharacterized protein n=1 Tax=Powellomyces hirtus TaxID=109895 RepID=A0A507DQ49_9FUNG|nr:hypothetical protein PhCBS80983_g06200 [Powellomyces hirtus]